MCVCGGGHKGKIHVCDSYIYIWGFEGLYPEVTQLIFAYVCVCVCMCVCVCVCVCII